MDPLTVTVITHRGRTRDDNQDAVVAGVATITGVSMPDPVTVHLPPHVPAFVAVADGLGGHAGGAVAAAHTVHKLAAVTAAVGAEVAGIADVLGEINRDLYDLPARQPECAGAATTVAGLLCVGADTYWFNVGDSRVYREDGGYLGQLSVDDSPQPVNGEPGAPGPRTSVVVQALGGAPVYTPIEPHIGADSVAGPGRWLLCSDGLSDLVDVGDMERIMATTADDGHAAKALWAAAMNAGGRDNITVALVRRAGVV